MKPERWQQIGKIIMLVKSGAKLLAFGLAKLPIVSRAEGLEVGGFRCVFLKTMEYTVSAMGRPKLIGILVLLVVLTLVTVDQSICFSCSFELPQASSHEDVGLEESCSLCLTLVQPAQPLPLLVALSVAEFQSPSSPIVAAGLSTSIFHPPRTILLYF